MKRFVVFIFALSSIANASSVIILGAEFDDRSNSLSLITLVDKADNQRIELKLGICQQSYPGKCEAELVVTPQNSNNDVKTGATVYNWETVKVDISHLSKPTKLIIHGDRESITEVMIGNAQF